MSRREIIAFCVRAALITLVGITMFVAALLIPAEIMASRASQQHTAQAVGRPHSRPALAKLKRRL
jgi:hypothetical protein